jgi:hypothetical protein
VIICVVFGYLGWSWRPQSSGFPAIPQGLSFEIQRGSDGLASEVLTRTDEGGATLELLIHADSLPDDSGPGAWTEASWELTIFGLDPGHLCTPESYSDGAYVAFIKPQTATRVKVPAAAAGVFPDQTVVRGSGFPARLPGDPSATGAYLRLCWDFDAPVQLNGSYLSARFPPIVVIPGAAVGGGESGADLNVSVARTLRPDAETADFAIQSQPRPTGAGPDSWEWAAQTSPETIQLSAIDVSDTQHAEYLTFLSGIALGLAGAAVIALLGEFILPLHQRREDRG